MANPAPWVRPCWYVVEERGLERKSVNARHVKVLPGRKPDVLDAEWLAELLDTARRSSGIRKRRGGAQHTVEEGRSSETWWLLMCLHAASATPRTPDHVSRSPDTQKLVTPEIYNRSADWLARAISKVLR